MNLEDLYKSDFRAPILI